MMNFRINMIRTTGKNDSSTSRLFQVPKGFFSLLLHILTHLCKFFPCCMCRCFDLFCRNILKHFNQAIRQNCFCRKCHKRIHKFNARIFQFIHVVLDIFCIRCNDRAVVMIYCIWKFITLIWHTWIENKLHTFFDQPAYMTMCQFCRITF